MVIDPVVPWVLLGIVAPLLLAIQIYTIRDIVRHPRITRDQKTGWIVIVLVVGVISAALWFNTEQRLGRD